MNKVQNPSNLSVIHNPQNPLDYDLHYIQLRVLQENKQSESMYNCQIGGFHDGFYEELRLLLNVGSYKSHNESHPRRRHTHTTLITCPCLFLNNRAQPSGHIAIKAGYPGWLHQYNV
jgi:hypothetical protein